MLYSNLFYEVVNYVVVQCCYLKKKTVNITIKNVTEDYYGEVTVIHYYQLKQPFFSNLWEMVKATTSWLFLMGYQRFITSTQNTGLP